MTLNRHLIDDVRVIGSRYFDARQVTPGSMVCHREFDKSSYGMVVHVGESWVTVLWSMEPATDSDFQALAKMAAPLSRRLNYNSVAQQVFKIEQMPAGAHTYYAKDEE